MVGFDDFRGVFQPKMILNSDFPHNTRYQGSKYLQLRRALQIKKKNATIRALIFLKNLIPYFSAEVQ